MGGGVGLLVIHIDSLVKLPRSHKNVTANIPLTIERLKADVSSVSPSSDEGLTLETSAFNVFTVANLPYQSS